MITANELKTRGIKAIEEQLHDRPEVVISVRGKIKYVAMTVEQYELMRQAEIEVAYQNSLGDIQSGKYVTETPEEHMNRLWSEND